jgi:hypothetical protein
VRPRGRARSAGTLECICVDGKNRLQVKLHLRGKGGRARLSG